MIYQFIEGLIQQGCAMRLIEETDRVYARNRLLNILKLTSFPEENCEPVHDTIPNLLKKIIQDAIDRHVIEDVFEEKEMLSAELMNCFMGRPSDIQKSFEHMFDENPKIATDYFYQLSINSQYIQMDRIQKNIDFKVQTSYGTMDITINLSKPEKDPEQIKRERLAPKTIDYPTCVLCITNEGYAGRTGHPARANHRMIRIPLLGETWYFQYSPYVYYQEHSILLAETHRPMVIDRETFARLLAFVEMFPHYFIGSNADLPIVGGSILGHDHYQAGRYTFPMEKAPEKFSFRLNNDDQVQAYVLDWPLATIRLRSDSKDAITNAADEIFEKWKHYEDREAHIIPFTGDERHQTVTPIARMKDNQFEMDIVLRNNRTTDKYPLGLFHPHPDVHHIKKENIGLIEVMGLAVLPGRLAKELADIEQYLLTGTGSVATYHQAWVDDMQKRYHSFKDQAHVQKILKNEVGKKFEKVLKDAGVFKTDRAFKRFIRFLTKSSSG